MQVYARALHSNTHHLTSESRNYEIVDRLVKENAPDVAHRTTSRWTAGHRYRRGSAQRTSSRSSQRWRTAAAHAGKAHRRPGGGYATENTRAAVTCEAQHATPAASPRPSRQVGDVPGFSFSMHSLRKLGAWIADWVHAPGGALVRVRAWPRSRRGQNLSVLLGKMGLGLARALDVLPSWC